MKIMRSVYLFSFVVTSVVLSGCSSIQYEAVQNRTSHFMCFEQDKITKHYFINTFAIEPTLEQKKNELLLSKLRMEKQLQTKLIDCREVAAEDVPHDLALFATK